MYKVKSRAGNYPINERRTTKAPKTNLERDMAAAAAAGMSYGQYKAMHPNTAPPKKEERRLPAPSDPITKPRAEPREVYNRTCAVCGQPFETHNKRRTYCSDKCAHQAATDKRRARQRPSAPAKKVCPVCGEAFLADSHQRVYCSTKCRNKYHANPARRYGNG